MLRFAFLLAALGVLASTTAAPAMTDGPAHALALFGKPRQPEGFRHFDYVDPAAVPGGELRLHETGTFDSFNPFALGGIAANAVGHTYETLMVRSGDEPFARYCLICKTVEVAGDRSWIEFTLRPEARFHDGSPITAEDVLWSFETLRSKGHPFFRTYYADATGAEKTDAHRVKFKLAGDNRALPLLLGDLPVLSRAWWSRRDIGKVALEPPLGSGPYRVESFEPGRFVVLRRADNHWSKDHPVNRHRFNFERLRIEYFRDETVALEAFKAGAIDIRVEGQAVTWATQYDSPAIRQGLIARREIPEDRVSGMQGYVFNTRRPPFDNRLFRKALTYAFDFEWTNRTLFHGAYVRTRSYFNNAELAARGLPGPDELALLEPWRGRIPDEVFTREYNPPATDGSGGWRQNQRTATRLLREAGYRIEKQTLVSPDGAPVSFEILLNNPQFERVTLPYVEHLKRLGIAARVRTVDTAQFQARLNSYDFDMTVATFGQSEVPGAEQRGYWGSDRADRPGGLNLAGIRDPAVDALVELIVRARDHDTLVTRVRALDRLLQWGIYAVPHWHSKVDRVAYWDRFRRPERSPKYGFDPDTWWRASDGAAGPRDGAAIR